MFKSVTMEFNTQNAFEKLELMSQSDMDMLNYGVVKMDLEGNILMYNVYERDLSGHELQDVLNKNFFLQVAPCTNNYMVANQFETNEELDDIINYIFTYGMKPTKVKLRMLKRKNSKFMYLLVEKK